MRSELLIVGAGPTGVSAALWAKGLSLSALLIDRAASPGGQLHMVHFAPRDVAGVTAADGPAMAAAYESQLSIAGVAWRRGAAAKALEPPGPGRPVPSVVLEDGTRLEAEAVLVATGARRRRLDVPGARELEGRGVSYSATRDRAWLAGRRVAVLGGGDAAFENALILAAVGCDVTLLARGAARARPDFRVRVAAEPRIRVAEGVVVRAILGHSAVQALAVEDASGAHTLEVEGVVVKIGVIPNSEWCREALAHDRDGWLSVDGQFATSAPRVWAAGDVVRPLLPSIAVSMAQGAQAVAVIRRSLHGA